MNRKKMALCLLSLCLAFAGMAQEVKNEEPQAEFRFELPSFKLESAAYGNVSTDELKGKVVLVSLFATWCGPCQKELAEVEKVLWPKYKENKDFVLLVIGREHTEEQLKVYNEKKKFSFPLYPDPERKVFSLFAEQSIPRAYLFDKEGKCIHFSIGYTPEEFKELMEKIEEALK